MLVRLVSGTGGAIVSKFSGCLTDGFTRAKNWGEGRGQRPENWHFSFLAGPAGHAPREADWALRWALDRL